MKQYNKYSKIPNTLRQLRDRDYKKYLFAYTQYMKTGFVSNTNDNNTEKENTEKNEYDNGGSEDSEGSLQPGEPDFDKAKQQLIENHKV